MKILVLGGEGMLGHVVRRYFENKVMKYISQAETKKVKIILT